MKRIFLAIALILTLALPLCTRCYATAMLDKGAFILVHAKKVFSSETLQEGDKVYFVAVDDVWVDETNIIPKNTIFSGYVSMLKMPIKGINAALKFKITHITLPSGETRNFDGYISNGKGDMIGGEQTPPASYNKMAHLYPSRLHWSGTTQWVPSGEYEYGQHRGVKPGQNLFVVVESPYVSE